MTSIFISRPLRDDSVIKKKCVDEKIVCTDMSLVRFEPVVFDLPETEWLFFYSPKGVEFFCHQYPGRLNLDKFRIACFGPGTGKSVLQWFGRLPQVTGTGESEGTEDMISGLLQRARITFIRGSNSIRSVENKLSLGENHDFRIVYKNTPYTALELHHFDLAIMTSSMNAKSFKTNKGSASAYIAIGKTTASEMYKMDMRPLEVSKTPDEASLVYCITKILSNKNL